jgi:hypothetical protein
LLSTIAAYDDDDDDDDDDDVDDEDDEDDEDDIFGAGGGLYPDISI